MLRKFDLNFLMFRALLTKLLTKCKFFCDCAGKSQYISISFVFTTVVTVASLLVLSKVIHYNSKNHSTPSKPRGKLPLKNLSLPADVNSPLPRENSSGEGELTNAGRLKKSKRYSSKSV